MKFVNRIKELNNFEKLYGLSKKKCFSTVLYGQRRIGKTKLVREFMKDKPKKLFFFVDDSKNSQLLLEEYVEILKNQNLLGNFEKINTWNEFVEFLFVKCEDYLIVFDEFQNFLSVDRSVFSIFQKNFDIYEDNKLLFIFLGSIIGLIKEVFENQKAPLYGRIKNSYHLKALNFKNSCVMLKNLGFKKFEEYVEFYSVFGGYPKYYVLLEDYDIKELNTLSIIEKFIFSENGILEKEIYNTLKLNFGNGKTNYYGIMDAISLGNNNLSNIANYVGLQVNSISFFINELVNFYDFIDREVPNSELDAKKSKKGIYKLKNNMMNFYFRYVHKNSSLIQSGNIKMVMEKIKIDFNKFVSFSFEDIVREFVLQRKEFSSYSRVGREWGKFKGLKGSNSFEIDVCAVNEKERKILFGEVKWKDNIDGESLLKDLREKGKKVLWNFESREEEYVLFAKSFKNKPKGIKCFDLKDLEKHFLK